MFSTTDSADDVELTLIRWVLPLTPAERLETAQQYADFVIEAHHRTSQPLPDVDEPFDLETLIVVKEKAGREKDRAMLPVLRRALEKSRRR